MRKHLDSVIWVGVCLMGLALLATVMAVGSIPLHWLAGGISSGGPSMMFAWWPAALLLTLIMLTVGATSSRTNRRIFFWIGPLAIARPGWITSAWLLYY